MPLKEFSDLDFYDRSSENTPFKQIFCGFFEFPPAQKSTFGFIASFYVHLEAEIGEQIHIVESNVLEEKKM